MSEIKNIAILDSIRFIVLPVNRRAEICEAVKAGMQALREKQEQHDCDCCATDREREDIAESVYLDRNLLTIDIGGACATIPVSYCPVCGRKLKDKLYD